MKCSLFPFFPQTAKIAPARGKKAIAFFNVTDLFFKYLWLCTGVIKTVTDIQELKGTGHVCSVSVSLWNYPLCTAFTTVSHLSFIPL